MKLTLFLKEKCIKNWFEMYKRRFFFFFECNTLEVNSQVASAAARLLFSKTDASSKGFPLSWVKRPTLSHSGLVELLH